MNIPAIERRNDDHGPSTFPARQTGLTVQMDELERELNKHDPLGDIARLVRKLTYGEMVELAACMWAAKTDDAVPLTMDSLPSTLHRWSTMHGKVMVELAACI